MNVFFRLSVLLCLAFNGLPALAENQILSIHAEQAAYLGLPEGFSSLGNGNVLLHIYENGPFQSNQFAYVWSDRVLAKDFNQHGQNKRNVEIPSLAAEFCKDFSFGSLPDLEALEKLNRTRLKNPQGMEAIAEEIMWVVTKSPTPNEYFEFQFSTQTDPNQLTGTQVNLVNYEPRPFHCVKRVDFKAARRVSNGSYLLKAQLPQVREINTSTAEMLGFEAGLAAGAGLSKGSLLLVTQVDLREDGEQASLQGRAAIWTRSISVKAGSDFQPNRFCEFIGLEGYDRSYFPNGPSAHSKFLAPFKKDLLGMGLAMKDASQQGQVPDWVQEMSRYYEFGYERTVDRNEWGSEVRLAPGDFIHPLQLSQPSNESETWLKCVFPVSYELATQIMQK